MLSRKELKQFSKNIKSHLPHIILPVLISLSAIFAVILSFFIFSQRIFFFYDPHTLKISNYSISQIKRAGLKYQLFIKPIETNYEDFPEIFNNLSDKEKRKKIIITSYLYSMLREKEEFFDNCTLLLYGPLFDYERDIDSIDVQISISNKTNLGIFLRESEKLVFFVPESILFKAVKAEPETTLISMLSDVFYSLKKDGTTTLLSFGNIGKNPLFFEENSINVLCLRKITQEYRSLITESGGKVLFFDHINSRNLKNSLYVNKDSGFSASLSYDYKYSLDKIFKNILEKTEKKVNYVAVFSFLL